ncbi:hypothetical protein ACUNWD_15130 [Sunxiuqinia sp. A32]|uniref:hypothetical protein n=1 Tax=Sunxiuqinia sp. A32 TaxID=3461496 RepID=UPI00404607EA
MADYTICPKFIEQASINKNLLYDVLWVFLPNNSKRICVDTNEVIIDEYNKTVKNDKELLDWYRFLTMRRELNIAKTEIDKNDEPLQLNICRNSLDKLLISDCRSHYNSYSEIINKAGIKVLDKNLAAVHLNYGGIDFPLNTTNSKLKITEENVFSVVKDICQEFKDLIENKGMFKLLVNKAGERVPEKTAQLLFFGVAYSYCSANDLKLSPEVDSGNGPVDFNLSQGFKANINVEMKIADNKKLEKGLWSQLEIYNRAENSYKSIYLIVKYDDLYDKKIAQLERVLIYRKGRGENLPELVIVDSTFKESASTR